MASGDSQKSYLNPTAIIFANSKSSLYLIKCGPYPWTTGPLSLLSKAEK